MIGDKASTLIDIAQIATSLTNRRSRNIKVTMKFEAERPRFIYDVIVTFDEDDFTVPNGLETNAIQN